MEGNRFLELVCEHDSIQVNNLITKHVMCLIGALNPLSNPFYILETKLVSPLCSNAAAGADKLSMLTVKLTAQLAFLVQFAMPN
ncbi:MAG: hypothetical protein ACKESB_03110 [Candidatus Hodgkinia cicadicola]